MASCFRCRKVGVPYHGEFCAECASKPSEPPKVIAKIRTPRGPTPDAWKNLRMLVRDQETMMRRLRRRIYETDKHGKVMNVEYSDEIAGQLVELGREVVNASKEARQWEELKKQRAAKKTIHELIEDAVGFLTCDKVANEDRRVVVKRLLDSLGEPALKSVP